MGQLRLNGLTNLYIYRDVQIKESEVGINIFSRKETQETYILNCFVIFIYVLCGNNNK